MTTTTARPTAPARAIDRPARIGMVGGALWALLPVAWTLVSTDDVEFGTLPFVAAAASYWLFAVLPPLLVVVGVTALRRVLGAGRLGATGLVVFAIGMTAMSLGIGIEVASISFGGGEVALGHALLLIGFLVSVVGAVLVGGTVLRRRRDRLSRIAGVLLVVAFPLGLGIGLLGSTLDPENDAWFWAAITVPMGLAWVLLGRSLAVAHRSPAV